MAILSALSGANLTAIRASGYRASQYAVLCPNTVVVQFLVGANTTDSVVNQITVGAIQSGNMANISTWQTVIFSTGTDHVATEFARTYVRKVSGTTILYIGEYGNALTTAHYVTVIDAYHVFEIPHVKRDGVSYINWEDTFEKSPPVETALPSAAVLTDGTVIYSPVAAPVAMATGASITTHAWASSNSSDTLDSGGTTNNPTFTLQANSFRHILYTFTDSNGVSGLHIIPVWTIPADLSGTVKTGFIDESGNVSDIRYEGNNLGWTAEMSAFADVSGILKETLICLFSEEWYNGTKTNIRTNINFVGYLAPESTQTRGTAEYGALSEVTFTCNGFGVMMQNTPISKLPVETNESPTAWGQLPRAEMTPAHAIQYYLRHSTIRYLVSINYPSDNANFVADDDFLWNQEDTVLDAITKLIETCHGVLQFDVNGIMHISRNLSLLPTAERSGAITVADFTTSDLLDFQLSVNPVPDVRITVGTSGLWNTNSNTWKVFRSYVPPLVRTRGIQKPVVVNQILTTDATEANARTENASRVANLDKWQEESDVLEVALADPWHFLVPDLSARYTFTIAASDNTRGRAFTTADKWQLTSISYTTNNQTGTRDPRGSFRLETDESGANAWTETINPDNVGLLDDWNIIPAIMPSNTDADSSMTDGISWILDPTEPTPPGANCERTTLRSVSNTFYIGTIQSTIDQDVLVEVYGSGKLSGQNFNHGFAYDQWGWAVDPFGLTVGTGGVYTTGVGFEDTQNTENDGQKSRDVRISRAWGCTMYITKAIMTYSYDKGSVASGLESATAIAIHNNNGGYSVVESLTFDQTTDGSGLTMTWEPATPTASDGMRFQARCALVAPAGSIPDPGSSTITRVEIFGQNIRGDAFYIYSDDGTTAPTAYASGDGFQWDSGDVTSYPEYNEDHYYVIAEKGDGGVARVDFNTPAAYTGCDRDDIPFTTTLCFLED